MVDNHRKWDQIVGMLSLTGIGDKFNTGMIDRACTESPVQVPCICVFPIQSPDTEAQGEW